MLAALIILLVIVAALVVTTIVLVSNLIDKENNLQYAKREAKDYRDRYYANDRRESFEIEKERKEHESSLRISEAGQYAQQRHSEAVGAAEIRLYEESESDRLKEKALKRLQKRTEKALDKFNEGVTASDDLADWIEKNTVLDPSDNTLKPAYAYPFGHFHLGIDPISENLKADTSTPAAEASENPPFPEVATVAEAES